MVDDRVREQVCVTERVSGGEKVGGGERKRGIVKTPTKVVPAGCGSREG